MEGIEMYNIVKAICGALVGVAGIWLILWVVLKFEGRTGDK